MNCYLEACHCWLLWCSMYVLFSLGWIFLLHSFLFPFWVSVLFWEYLGSLESTFVRWKKLMILCKLLIVFLPLKGLLSSTQNCEIYSLLVYWRIHIYIVCGRLFPCNLFPSYSPYLWSRYSHLPSGAMLHFSRW